MKRNYIYLLNDGTSFNAIFQKKHFAHLLGLHKIEDVPQLKKLANKKYSGDKVFKEIKNDIIKDEQIFKSPYFPKMEDRYKYFLKLEDIVFQKVVFDFDKAKAASKIDADMMMYTIIDGLYLHLFLVRSNNGAMVPMTFVVEPTNRFVDGQTDIDIRELHIEEKDKEPMIYQYIVNVPEYVAPTLTAENEEKAV